MKQQISLYSFDDDIENLWLNSNRMLNITFLFIGLLTVITCTVIWQNISDKKELKNVEAQISDSFRRESVANQKLDAAMGSLKEKIIYDKYKAEYDSKIRQYEVLKSNGIIQDFKIGGFLDGLGHNMVLGLWLTKIAIGEYGANMALEGSTVNIKLIPMFIEKLEKNKVFGGKISKGFYVTKDSKSEQQNFTINIMQSVG